MVLTMVQYSYKARDSTGTLVQGQVLADSRDAARKQVLALNLIPSQIDASRWGQLKSKILTTISQISSRVSIEEMVVFNRQLQMVITVGIPLVKGLRFIADQTDNRALKKALVDIVGKVSEGMPLSQTMGSHPQIFDKTYVSLVRAGESSGQLDSLLDRISTLSESRAENRAKVKSALFYPKIVVGLLVLVFLIIVYYVIPKLSKFYEQLKMDLPFITRFVVGVSDFFLTYWYLIFAVGVGAVYGWNHFISTEKGRAWWHQKILSLPLFGSLLLNIEMNSFATVMNLLIKSGLTIVNAIDISKESLTNETVITDLTRVQGEISAGAPLGASLSQSKVFPSLVSNLMSMGEEAGSLEEVLAQISRYYKGQINYRLDTLSKAIEPLLLVAIFGMVLVLALALFLPMWQMSGALKKKP